jgi:hypothetical protein
MAEPVRQPIDPHEQEDTQAPASSVLEGVVANHAADKMTFGEIMAALHERGFALLMAIFVLPNCVPVPIPPGGSTILSIPVLFLAVQMAYGRQAPWLPQWLQTKTIKRSTMALVIEKISPRLKRLEKVLRRRLFPRDPDVMEKTVGCIAVVFGLCIAIPLPMTNFLPGVGILVMSLGLLSRDGIIILLGMTIGTAGIAFTTALLMFGQQVVLGALGIQ